MYMHLVGKRGEEGSVVGKHIDTIIYVLLY